MLSTLFSRNGPWRKRLRVELWGRAEGDTASYERGAILRLRKSPTRPSPTSGDTLRLDGTSNQECCEQAHETVRASNAAKDFTAKKGPSETEAPDDIHVAAALAEQIEAASTGGSSRLAAPPWLGRTTHSPHGGAKPPSIAAETTDSRGDDFAS